MAAHNSKIVRLDPCPDKVALQLTLRRSHLPELAKWIWDRPYKSAAIVKMVLDRALRSGELDLAEKEVGNVKITH